MPPKGKGGKNRRRGKGEGGMSRELVYKEEGQEYAQVIRMLGNCQLEALCFDDVGAGKRRLCIIRGKMRKKVWIRVNDVILVSLREFQDDKADVIQKYTPDEVRQLKAEKLIPADIREGDDDENGGDIVFGAGSDDSDSDSSSELNIDDI